jgi:hypothetical protein
MCQQNGHISGYTVFLASPISISVAPYFVANGPA